MGEVPGPRAWRPQLSQSGVILDYLAQRFTDFAPKSEEERREVLRWTLWDNHKLTALHRQPALPDEVRPRGEDRPGRHRLARRPRSGNALKVLDRHLFTNEWIAADHITTADLSCVGYLYFDHEFGHDLTDLPNIERWRQHDRRPARLEASLRPDAGPPDPGRSAPHDRRLYLRRDPHAARQGAARRRAARGDRASACRPTR